jgi:hypothetical protein
MGRRREGVKKYLHTYPIQTAKENKPRKNVVAIKPFTQMRRK